MAVEAEFRKGMPESAVVEIKGRPSSVEDREGSKVYTYEYQSIQGEEIEEEFVFVDGKLSRWSPVLMDGEVGKAEGSKSRISLPDLNKTLLEGGTLESFAEEVRISAPNEALSGGDVTTLKFLISQICLLSTDDHERLMVNKQCDLIIATVATLPSVQGVVDEGDGEKVNLKDVFAVVRPTLRN